MKKEYGFKRACAMSYSTQKCKKNPTSENLLRGAQS